MQKTTMKKAHFSPLSPLLQLPYLIHLRSEVFIHQKLGSVSNLSN